MGSPDNLLSGYLDRNFGRGTRSSRASAPSFVTSLSSFPDSVWESPCQRDSVAAFLSASDVVARDRRARGEMVIATAC
jgi:hypothetical protein